jgi:glycosyltransferase involved in cell wall biosynthesis
MAMKIDMHLHSKHSKRPSQWVLQKLGCPESFTEPSDLWRITRRMGMDGLTLTDHNTIAGCLEIAHLPNTFVSEEVTTYFPEDGCKVHVLVWDITEQIHTDIQKIRENIFDLVAYLNQNNILHALAHPLFSINDRLTLEHFEKFLLLFRTFELNGARDDKQNMLIRSVVKNLTESDIRTLADKHDLEPLFIAPWRKGLVGGSDDHSAVNIARSYTEVKDAETVAEFLGGIRSQKCEPQGKGSSPMTLAHNLYAIAYQYFNSRIGLQRYANHDVLMRFLDRLLKPESHSGGWVPLRLKRLWSRRAHRLAASDKLQDIIQHEGAKTVLNDPKLAEIVRGHAHSDDADKDERWFRFVNSVCNSVLSRFSHNLFDHLSGANVFSIFGSIGAAGSLYSLMAPYFVSYGLFSRDRRLVEQVRHRFIQDTDTSRTASDNIKVAHFTDTYYEINGVATTLRQQADLAAKIGKDLTIITCDRQRPAQVGRVRNFEPVEIFELPEYPEQKLFVPPFLEMLRYLYDGGYTYIHSATPGPVGLAALAMARILRLPISGTYHTAIPQYAKYLTGDDAIEQLVWKFTLWYYDQMDMIYVPSRDTGEELIEKGISPDKIMQYPRGVDTVRFHPRYANGFYRRRFGLSKGMTLLYVGRVSKEKDMPVLVEAFEKLCREFKDLHLMVVGDGPYYEEMKRETKSLPVTMAGYLEGQDLSEAYASADVFVFPSTTDTFGNVILESQASGLPVVVTDIGGPRENMIPGKTGLVAKGGDAESLAQAVRTLIQTPEKLADMGKAAREYMDSRSFENAFLEHWKLYTREHGDNPDIMAKAV